MNQKDIATGAGLLVDDIVASGKMAEKHPTGPRGHGDFDGTAGKL